MLLAELRIENFRMFGEGNRGLVLPIRRGLTAIVGENDSGKTAVIDALRLALGTRDQEWLRVDESDFYQSSDGNERSSEIRISCKFEYLTLNDCQCFVEHLTYERKGQGEGILPVFYLNWMAMEWMDRSGRRRVKYEIRSGKVGDGPIIGQECRELLLATYLRPLRDAQRALASGRGSRLSQVLQNTSEIKEFGTDYDPKLPPSDLSKLSVLGIGDLADSLLANHRGVMAARNRLNNEFLENISFGGDSLESHISVSSSCRDDSIRLRRLLEKFDLELRGEVIRAIPFKHGLGSNNLLFIACELLLTGPEGAGLPLLLIEEPEAHLHPQRQLRLMQFLQRHTDPSLNSEQGLQIIVTTHSPNLASVIDLDNIVLMHTGKAYSLAFGNTELDKSDYGFLKRFLDVTKANLFFARGVMIVEGDSENILLPSLAALLDKDFTKHGVSIVNVGGIGLRRFARIFLRKDTKKDDEIAVFVACVTDFDVMPDCAPEVMKKVQKDEPWPEKKDRRWRAKKDFDKEGLQQEKIKIRNKAHSQYVKTFVADEWTLEYDLAFFGLAKEVWIAAKLAKADEEINDGKKNEKDVRDEAVVSFTNLIEGLSNCEVATQVYAFISLDSKISKVTTAQYLANLLYEKANKKDLGAGYWENVLPPYIVEAIEYVTGYQDMAKGR